MVQKTSESKLAEAGFDSARIDVSVLLCHVLDKPSSYLFTWPERELTESQLTQLEQLITRRLSGEPIAYIVGWREFWSLPLKVSPATLIPRPDTERLVELALDKLTPQCQILDLGTGTGAIALAIASERPDCQITGIDLQPEAQILADENRERLEINNCQFLAGSWYQPLKNNQKFHIIVSNPPYIDQDDPHLAQGDVRFEPLSALVAENKGLADLDYIVDKGRDYLQPKGWILLEHGYQQGDDVRAILEQYGYQYVVTELDYAGHGRVTVGQWPAAKI
ncbi:peptide chain release factor N(5)-glutamine methyltransferase [Vibrio sp. SS-MA-C1-2]|nr:peptide chain release factor N(5)-glutamine methyltransferase [Vibrio sp. SS-MA-C1-2]